MSSHLMLVLVVWVQWDSIEQGNLAGQIWEQLSTLLADLFHGARKRRYMSSDSILVHFVQVLCILSYR
jgi:hypothetical protein